MNYDYETGFDIEFTDPNENVKVYQESNIFKHTRHAALCSKCFNIKGRVNYKAFQTVYVEIEDGENFTEKEIKNQIMKTSSDLWTSTLRCTKCKKRTRHFWVDDAFAKLIQTINLKGYKTIYSCAGHINNNGVSSYPYILIKGWNDFIFLPDGWRYNLRKMELKNGDIQNVTRIEMDLSSPMENYNKIIEDLVEYFNRSAINV